jgi:hypothetical protein
MNGNPTRRDFGKTLGLAALALATGSSFLVSGCSLASALTEADNILLLISPLGDGIAAIVEIADPLIAPAVAAAVKVYDLAVTTVDGLLKQWAAAAAAAQPGILSQALAAVTVLQQDAANLITAAQVKATAAAAQISAVTGVVLKEIAALLTVIPQIGALGGTTAAAAMVVRKYATGGLFHHVNLDHLRSAKQNRSDLVARLKTATGTAVDPACVNLAMRLEELPLK